jgi:hypothetical protein
MAQSLETSPEGTEGPLGALVVMESVLVLLECSIMLV